MVLSHVSRFVWRALACTLVLAGCGPTPAWVGSTAGVQSGTGHPSVHDCDRRKDGVADSARPLVEGQEASAEPPDVSIADARISPVAADWPNGASVRTIRPTSDDPNRLTNVEIPSTHVLEFSIEGMYQPLLLELTAYESTTARLSGMAPRDALFCSVRLVSGSSVGSSHRTELPEGMTVVVIQGFFPKLPGMDVPPSAVWAVTVDQ